MSFSSNAYKTMRKKKMKQSAVAIEAGLTPQQFNDLLHGRKLLREEFILPICRALECTPNDLFIEEEGDKDGV